MANFSKAQTIKRKKQKKEEKKRKEKEYKTGKPDERPRIKKLF